MVGYVVWRILLKEQLLSGSKTMAAHSYDEIRASIQQLTLEEQLKLMEELLSVFRQKFVAAPLQVSEEVVQPDAKEETLHDIMEYAGFAKELWKGVDVEAYLNEERNSWDR
jgi:hypothetical protein